MRWFGGFSRPAAPPSIPAGARSLWPTLPGCWLVGSWPQSEVRACREGGVAVAVLGPCGADATEVARLLLDGVPDGVAWRWPGSYTVVRTSAEETTIWSDLGGAWPMYTTVVAGGVYWSSSARSLAGLTRGGVDVDRLASTLVAPSAAGLVEGRSFFADVDVAPPGHRISLSDNGSISAVPVWRPTHVHRDHVRRLRVELSASVAVRVDGARAPSVDLSGGFDSTSLALLAAGQLYPAATVTGVTLHPQGTSYGGDLSYARLAGAHPGITHRLLPLGAQHRPYGRLGEVPAGDEPAPSTIGYAAFSHQMRYLAELGSDCHMTGDGGDALLWTPSLFLADLVRARRYPRALTEAVRWARVTRRPVTPLLRAAMRTAGTTRAAALADLARSLRTPAAQPATKRGDVAWFPPVGFAQWATQSLRDRIASIASSLVDSDDPAWWPDHTTRHIADAIATTGRTAHADAQLAGACGVGLHNPYCDSRLIDTVLSIPGDDRSGPAEYKPLMRHAMADLFPPALAMRVTKGDLSADYYQGLRANLADVHALTDGHLVAAGLVDPAAFTATLTLAAAGIPAAYSSVEQVVSAEVWLRALHTAPDVAWTTHLSGVRTA